MEFVFQILLGFILAIVFNTIFFTYVQRTIKPSELNGFFDFIIYLFLHIIIGGLLGAMATYCFFAFLLTREILMALVSFFVIVGPFIMENIWLIIILNKRR